MRPLDGVKELRERRMLSQQELAERAGVSLFTIQRIERGDGAVRQKTGRAVAAALGVEVEDLLPKAPAPPAQPEAPQATEERRTRYLSTWTTYLNREADRYEAEFGKICSSLARKQASIEPDFDEDFRNFGRIEEMISSSRALIEFETLVLWPRVKAEWERVPPTPEEYEEMLRMEAILRRVIMVFDQAIRERLPAALEVMRVSLSQEKTPKEQSLVDGMIQKFSAQLESLDEQVEQWKPERLPRL